MEARKLLYIYLYYLLVNVVAGNDVITFNQDRDLAAEDNIDNLLQTEQLIKVVEKRKSPKIDPNKLGQDIKTLEQQQVVLSQGASSRHEHVQMMESSSTHNCTKSHGGLDPNAYKNSSVRLRWDNLDAAVEFEEDNLPAGLDGDFLVSQDEAELYRYRRAATSLDVGSGENSVSAKLTLKNGDLTNEQTIVDSPANLDLKKKIADALKAYLKSKFPNSMFTVLVKSLLKGSIIATCDIVYTYDFSANITLASLAEKFKELQVLVVGNASYNVGEILLGQNENSLTSLQCNLCKPYEHCIGNSIKCVLKDTRLYPFGPDQADETLPKDKELATKRIDIDEMLPWNQLLVRRLWVSANGIISFNEEFASYFPRRLPYMDKMLLAVYWSDLDLVTGDTGEVYIHTYTKGDNLSSPIMSKANSDVMNNTQLSTYDASMVIVVTWYDVSPFPVNDEERVSFQCVIITDHQSTYVLYTYAQGAMHFDASLKRDVEIGWGKINLDSRLVNYYTFDIMMGNTGALGKWFFKIGEVDNPRSKCINWYIQNLYDFPVINVWDSLLPKCPCKEISAVFSGFWLPSFTVEKCYESFPNFGGFGRRCCYQKSSISGSFEMRRPFSGSLMTSNPYGGRYYQQMHEKNDLQPKTWCCAQSNLCYLYYLIRPESTCLDLNIFRASSVGDPHIVSLDGYSFIFNGLGEFRILEVIAAKLPNSNLTANFRLQGRTCQAKNAAGNKTSATIWCALALTTTDQNNLLVELNPSGTSMIIYANGQDLSQRFRDNEKFSELNNKLMIRNVNGSLKVSTSDNIGITVSVAYKLLEFTVDIDPIYKNMTKGLMGNFNGDNTDDLIYPNGTMLPNTTSERNIFKYGYAWLIDESTSLFTYMYGTNFSTFNDLTFEPIFMDEVNKTVRQEAEQVCQSVTNLPCIFDYVATQNKDLAKGSMMASDKFSSDSATIANQAPVINGSSQFNITLNTTLTLNLSCSDPDKDNFTVNATSRPEGFNYTFDPQSGICAITFTPTKITNETFQIVLTDSKGVDSLTYIANLIVCSSCSHHGNCSFSSTQAVTPYYSIASCNCNTGYTGDNCEQDRDGCASNPCPPSTNCTDVPADEEVKTGQLYTCSDCPPGYVLNSNGTKCEDINECNSLTVCDANADCSNTIGGYVCTCKPGFRKVNNKCVDINECVENLHRCAQICNNTAPGYNCDCYEGFDLNGFNCTRKQTQIDVCASANKQCEYGCRNKSGAAECFCQNGMKLKTDGLGCEDIDECQQNPCSQFCNNTQGSYFCSCYIGYSQSITDRHICEACSGNSYGLDCKYTCHCRGHASSCDAIRGCICDSGWTGTECEIDRNECIEYPNICPRDQICTNTNGSYSCSCPAGYDIINGSCTNRNECDSLDAYTCSQICVDNPGSFSCDCYDGFMMSSNNTCVDINECEENIAGCAHNCNNTHGSYNCICQPGFQLADDRKTCQKVHDPCLNLNINCSFECSIINNTAQCFCPMGFILGNDGLSCFDINECNTNGTYKDKCSDSCINTLGSYNCSCPIGKQLQSDKRTCQDCDSYHWGNDCSKECGCYPIGTEVCDPVIGCKCKSGWAGAKCMQDINECNYITAPCPPLSSCINTPGSFICQCSSGFKNDNGTCVDINECADNPCDQQCTNVIGSYNCYCYKGFKIQGTKCIDINECSNPELNKCDQLCRNTEGSFACDCNDGYNLNITTFTDCILVDASKACSKSNCSHICNIESNKETCSCRIGYELNSDNKTCMNVNECSSDPCINGTCTDYDGGFSCSCSNGSMLLNDKVTCQGCDYGFYGTNCSSLCSCNTTNLDVCRATDGTCECKPGWEGDDCSVDIDECKNKSCPAHSQCDNSLGSYRCVCEPGYYSNENICQTCDPSHWGQDCSQTCECNFANTEVCNHTDGACLCQNGWSGSLCDFDIDECQNTSYCAGPNVTCVDTQGSAECNCIAGYEKPGNSSKCEDIDECLNPLLNNCGGGTECINTDGSFKCVCPVGYYDVNGSCSACNNTSYGWGCNQSCSCAAESTEDCNDVTGNCTCRPGWEGANCDIDVDECLINSTFCTYPNSLCVNINGSANCQCLLGYHNSNNSNCTACDGTHYGQNCSNICQCDPSNTQDCNDVNGTCTCKPGWTGVKCDVDIDECVQNTSYCQNSIETCLNLNGSAQCNCKDGFHRPPLGASCTACDSSHYGQDCASICTCIADNTQDCNDVNGTCTCKPGWIGANCDKLKDQCTNTSLCTNANETCYNISGSAVCDCVVGFTKPTAGAPCQACDGTHYGQNCSNICQCDPSNTQDCNDVNGTCTCKPGWTGVKCDVDIDECVQNTSYCQNSIETCLNLNGFAQCNCKDGFYRPTLGASCTEIFKTDIKIVLNTTNYNETVLNNTHQDFFRLRDELTSQLINITIKLLGSIKFIIKITHFTKGSLEVHTVLEYNGTNNNKWNADVDAAQLIFALPKTMFKVGDQLVSIDRVVLNNTTINSSSSRCDIFQITNSSCQFCQWSDKSNEPVCSGLETSNKDLIIGLAVGIPLFVIIAAVIAVCVWLYTRRKSARKSITDSEDRETPFRNFFATRLDTKGSWGTPSVYKADGFSEGSSSQNSRDGKLIRKTKQKPSDYSESAWHRPPKSATVQHSDSQEARDADPPGGQSSNFSWDYMFNLLEPHKGFEIKRPNVSPSPNPAFIKKHDSTHA